MSRLPHTGLRENVLINFSLENMVEKTIAVYNRFDFSFKI